MIKELIKLYPNVDKSILKNYKEAAAHYTYNEYTPIGDEGADASAKKLVPIKVDVADVIKRNFFDRGGTQESWEQNQKQLLAGFYPEMWHTIENFGLPYKQQKFKRPIIPKKLIDLQKRCDFVEDIWQELENNNEKYIEEWKFIQSFWHHRLYGKWVFIKGEPRWFDPFAFIYFNFWKIDIGAPHYFDNSRRKFIFCRYAYTTTEAVFKYRATVSGAIRYSNDEKQFERWIRDKCEPEKGNFIVDMAARTCFGVVEVKPRRRGGTYEAALMGFEIASSGEERYGAIQSMDGETALKTWEKAYEKPISSLPFFLVPSYYKTKEKIQFLEKQRASKSKGSSVLSNKGLGGELFCVKSADENALDGDKLYFVHNNEAGKTVNCDIVKRHNVLKPCLSESAGADIYGFAIYETTVEELENKGGKEFLELCKQSYWENRISDITGQTQSGLFVLFNSSIDGQKGFIDEWGDSIIRTPEKPVPSYTGKMIKIGALDYVLNELKVKALDETLAGQKTYQDFKRQFPINFADSFLSGGGLNGFNIKIISERLNEIEFNDSIKPIKGRFEWITTYQSVTFVPDIEGLWEVSYLFSNPEKEANQIISVDGQKRPLNPNRFVIGVDVYKFDDTVDNRVSLGGIAVFQDRDRSIDHTEDSAKWSSNRWVADYLGRPSVSNFSEEVLKAAIYYGGMVYPETNLPNIQNHFQQWGFFGYMLFDINPITMQIAPNPGMNIVGTASKQKLFEKIKTQIDIHGKRERHPRILNQILHIDGMKDMTNFDLFTAAGLSLMGIESSHRMFLQEDNEEYSEHDITITDLLEEYDN